MVPNLKGKKYIRLRTFHSKVGCFSSSQFLAAGKMPKTSPSLSHGWAGTMKGKLEQSHESIVFLNPRLRTFHSKVGCFSSSQFLAAGKMPETSPLLPTFSSSSWCAPEMAPSSDRDVSQDETLTLLSHISKNKSKSLYLASCIH